MSKAVLISIQPKWCELILKGEKVIEVRKTRPRLKPPFKCYIYQTKGKERLIDIMKDGDENYGEIYHGKTVFIKTRDSSGYKGLFGNEQKVIGEFICDKIERVAIPYPAYQNELDKRYIEQSCVDYYALHRYFGHDDGYFWHISNFKIYDKPKELSELRAICRHYDDGRCGDCEYYDYANNESYRYEECAVDGLKPITRPPQSWCYVEEVENDRARKIT